MVKNTTGGTGAKSLARKHYANTGNKGLRLPEDPMLERLGCVTKMFGNGMCEITLNDKNTLLGHIRNKFRGKQKRHNLININAVVLVGLREWENPHKSCDIMEIYDDHHIEQLSSIPSIKLDNLVLISRGGSVSTKMTTGDIDFTDDADNDDVIMPRQKNVDEVFDIARGDEIDVDDI